MDRRWNVDDICELWILEARCMGAARKIDVDVMVTDVDRLDCVGDATLRSFPTLLTTTVNNKLSY